MLNFNKNDIEFFKILFNLFPFDVLNFYIYLE